MTRTPGPVASGALALRTVSSAAAPKPLLAEDWVQALRNGDFREAALEMDRLPPSRAASPEVRYARARAAMELSDFTRAASELSGLDASLPMFSDEIRHDRAECALAIGPYLDAARFFATRADAESLVMAALAYERAGDPSSARTMLDRALRMIGSADDERATTLRVRARSLRAKVALATKDFVTAETDLRWLAVVAPASAAGLVADADLAALPTKARLTSDQELTRAKKLAEAGLLDEALRSIDAAATGPGVKPAPAELLRARGLACFASRKDYAKAATLLEQAAKVDSKEASHDEFLAARALSRAQDDATAITRYDSLVKRFPTSPFAEEARYQAARLAFLLGRWDEAAKGYRAYLASHPARHPGRFTEVVRRELGLTLLASKHPAEAASLFEDLAIRENDPLERGSLEELFGAALAEDGRRDAAVAALERVIRESPLTYPALVAEARLTALGSAGASAAAGDPPPKGAPPPPVELPDKVVVLDRLGLTLDAEEELARHEPEIIARYAPRGYEALCQEYAEIGSGYERYRAGRVAVTSRALERDPTDATRWAWDCVYPTPFADEVRIAESTHALPYGLVHAVMRQESAFKTGIVSTANAIGLLQILPTTATLAAKELGLDPDPTLLKMPAYNVELGAFYLQKMLATFDGHIALAVAAYNAGPRAVSRWLETGEELPLDVWVARIPFAETRGYVARVLGNLARYEYLRGGPSDVVKVPLALPHGIHVDTANY